MDEGQIKKLISRTARLGVEAPTDLLFLLPLRVSDYTRQKKISDIEYGEYGFFKLTCISQKKWESSKNKRMSGFRVVATDGETTVSMMINGMGINFCDLRTNDVFYCTGKIGMWNDNMQLEDVTWVDQSKIGKVFAEYRSIPKTITSYKVREKVQVAFNNFLDDAIERVISASCASGESDVIEKSGIPFKSLKEFFTSVHYPESQEEYDVAMDSAKKIAINEIVSFATQKEEIFVPESYIDIDREMVKKLISRIPFPLTQDQGIVIYDIVEDLSSEKPMNRLLSGDVGTGKTLSFMIPAVAALKAGKKVAIMVQSFLVASQIANEIKTTFPEVDVVFKAGKLKKKEVEEIDKKINEGKSIIVGTSSILNTLMKNEYFLDFLIVDEQHKMGKDQREALKKNHTNFLESTATAIPRTMAIVSHGGMEVSFLKDKPVYKNIKTMVWEENMQKELFKKVKHVVENGFQCALVYPVVDETDVVEEEDEEGNKQKVKMPETDEGGRKVVRHAVEAHEMLEKIFPNNVALLHGKMKDDEKSETLASLKKNEKQILVASSVIEIGVTLPSMMMVAVLDPDVHGVTSLHQLRGRVDRNGKITAMGLEPSFIMLVRRKMTEKISNRLNILVENDDGFDVAEQDMLQRGFGELSGARQSGSTSAIFLNMKLKPQDITDFIENSSVHSSDELEEIM